MVVFWLFLVCREYFVRTTQNFIISYDFNSMQRSVEKSKSFLFFIFHIYRSSNDYLYSWFKYLKIIIFFED